MAEIKKKYELESLVRLGPQIWWYQLGLRLSLRTGSDLNFRLVQKSGREICSCLWALKPHGNFKYLKYSSMFNNQLLKFGKIIHRYYLQEVNI